MANGHPTTYPHTTTKHPKTAHGLASTDTTIQTIHAYQAQKQTHVT